MLYDEKLAGEFARRMMEKGVYVVAFSFPVVPKGKARIRRLSAICFPAVIILRQTDGYTSGSVK